MKSINISNNKWNFVKDDGSYLLDEHVYYCYDFKEGFAVVKYNDTTFNFVSLEGKQLLKHNVYDCCTFYKGFAEVRINNIWYLIDKYCNFYDYKYKIDECESFKVLYKKYPNMRSELIEIIKKYTYHNVNEYLIMILI